MKQDCRQTLESKIFFFYSNQVYFLSQVQVINGLFQKMNTRTLNYPIGDIWPADIVGWQEPTDSINTIGVMEWLRKAVVAMTISIG